ncbi:MAG: hypothetical protein LM567_07720 [Desulfurococcaceae archaeon]|nr:hypothetical protein [Desulfurococcaceae archaeon]
MQKRLNLLITTYTLLTVISVISLYVLGEKRVDVYVSLNILAYYVSYATLRPTIINRAVRFLNIALFIVFTIIVSFRIYEVLTS